VHDRDCVWAAFHDRNSCDLCRCFYNFGTVDVLNFASDWGWWWWYGSVNMKPRWISDL